ncbi:MAG: alpha/beta hydrolase fold domain-containing protein [Saprospiraceae bacterium]|nr:alpha/beta hydrolase fold domain-containing protein [Saprospiraceae bacterium]
MMIYTPENLNEGQTAPAMIFFFGGGWNGGNINQFRPHAQHFSSKGIICILADYRVKSRQGTSPFEALKDAKSAIRFIKENATQLHIDTLKIIGSGGSAGGHLAAAAALCDSFNETIDDLRISSKTAALVLFNPVIDNGPGGYGYDRVGPAYKDFSPLHNISAGAPPTLLLLGSEDRLVPVETVKYYKKVMEKVGSRCDLFIYQNQQHGFFNADKEPYYSLTIAATEDFLISLGFISKD